MKIIGLSGKMQSGKTTVAEYLEDKGIGVIHGFSNGIKDAVVSLFRCNFMPYCLDRQSVKESVHKCGKTHREILQAVGLEMRNLWPDIWAEHWKHYMLTSREPIIVPDVRFPNEVKAIQDMGGIVIRLTRNPVDSDNETETALDECEQDTLCRSGKLDVFARKVRVADDEREGILLCDFLVHNSDLSIDETNRACFEIAKEYINEP